MMPEWLAIAIVVTAVPALVYWYFSVTEWKTIDRGGRGGDGGGGSTNDDADGGSDGGGDGGGGGD